MSRTSRFLPLCLTFAIASCTPGALRGVVAASGSQQQVVVTLPTIAATPAVCTGPVIPSAAQMTDQNPPTWRWQACQANVAAFRVQLDDGAAVVIDAAHATYTPAAALQVGNHTLWVAENAAGTWSAAVASNLAVLPRAMLTVADAQPSLDAGISQYGYPQTGGHTVAPAQLEIASPVGFEVSDTLQGGLGDCWVNAALGGLAFADPNFLNNSVKAATDSYGDPLVDSHGYRLYEVTLQYPGEAGLLHWHYLTDAQFPVDATGGAAYERWSSDGNMVKIGMPLLEKALAALQTQTNYLTLVSGGYSGLTGYQALGAGGWAATIFPAFIGSSGTNVPRAQAGSLYAAAQPGGKLATVADLNDGDFVPLNSLPSGATLTLSNGNYLYVSADGSNKITLINAHYYVFMGSTLPGIVRARNPWGDVSGPDGEFTMPAVDIAAIFNVFTEATLPSP